MGSPPKGWWATIPVKLEGMQLEAKKTTEPCSNSTSHLKMSWALVKMESVHSTFHPFLGLCRVLVSSCVLAKLFL